MSQYYSYFNADSLKNLTFSIFCRIIDKKNKAAGF